MTPVPVLFGVDDKLKRVGDHGLRQCPECKRETHFTEYEVHKQLDVFWIPAFTWNHYIAARCDVCGKGVRLRDG